MLTLIIRTDKPEAELGLYEDTDQLAYLTWPAHRQLAETVHLKLAEILETCSKKLTVVEAVIVYQGPGSFTGLRIGISVANGIADSLAIPIVGGSGEDWVMNGLKSLRSGLNDQLVTPQYGAPVHTTKPKS